MIQQRSFRDTLPFPAASIMAFLYLTFYFIMRFLLPRMYNFHYAGSWLGYITIYQWAFVFLIFTLAILMLIKFPNIGTTITLGLIMLIKIYWGVINISHYANRWFDGNFEIYELYGLISIFEIIIFLMLTVQSISTYSTAKMTFFNAVWFLPGLLSFTSLTIQLIQGFERRDIAMLLINSATQLFYALFLMLTGKWLADVAHLKHPDPNRPNDTVYNYREPRVTFVQPPVPPFAPQPPVAPVPPMPRVPVAPIVPPVAPVIPSAPVVQPVASQPIAKDPVEELKRYKDLLDDGLITQEEYDAKKKQLLNL